MISRFKASGSSFPSPVAAAEIERHDQDDYEGSERPTVVNGGKQGNPVSGLHRGLIRVRPSDVSTSGNGVTHRRLSQNAAPARSDKKGIGYLSPLRPEAIVDASFRIAIRHRRASIAAARARCLQPFTSRRI